MKSRETLDAFDRYLAGRDLGLDAVVIGVTALNLLGIVSRPTLGDCLALAPTAEELATIVPWVAVQDINPDWPAHVRATLADVGRRLGHGV
jgi:hypothetical protein